ncbi:prion-inhibition and propagation-domain-containing protein [Xylaria scruposa]|nr:prion-inhibition and propagation-domain-containing protein [Xylaria scruposa]
MNTASASIGLFTNAFKIYRKIAKAIDIGSKGPIWNLLMRIEHTRFEAWGLELGFIDKETGRPKNEGITKTEAMTELDEILQVETTNVLIQDILKSITSVLQDFEKSAEKYRLAPEEQEEEAENSNRRSGAVRKFFGRTKDFSMHLLMAINDEKKIEDLLKTLTTLNDGLQKVLSLPRETRVQKALPSGVLPDYRTAAELEGLLKILAERTVVASGMSTGMAYLEQYPALLATANVKYRCVEMATANLRHSEIPVQNLRIEETPTRAAKDLLWPSGIAIFDSGGSQKFHVLVEWRQSKPVSPGFDVPEKELTLRRNMLVQLLHETSNEPNAADYRVLDCLGYCRRNGQVEKGGQPIPIIGFVSKIPDWADGRKQPTTLHKLLNESFRSVHTPSLGARFQLAKQLATALYQLQCSQWLHRNLSSHQVVFFHDKTTGSLRFEEPFLIGLQYSRLDDQSSMEMEALGRDLYPAKYGQREPFSEGLPRILPNPQTNWGSLDLYLHPDFSKKQRRYRRSDDVYSVGIILLEIARWEPVDAFREEDENVQDIAQRVVEDAKEKLSAVVGEIYRDAVVHCLEGIRRDVPKHRHGKEDVEGEEDVEEEEPYSGEYRGEDPEIGLEADFHRMVLNEIAKCRV